MKPLVARIIMLVAATALASWAFFANDWVPFATAILGIIWCIEAICRIYRQSEQKVTRLLDAVENNDGSFRFNEKASDTAYVNKSLNRIAAILSRARAETVRQERYLEHILNVVSTGILVINAEGYVERTNRRALELLGMEACTHLRRIESVSPTLASLLANGEPGCRQQVEYMNGTPPRTLNIHISTVTIRERQLRIAAIDDIDRELDNRETDSWNRTIRVLTHEIMNALSPITSLSDSMLHSDQGQLPEHVRHGLETISATGRDLSGFVTSYRRLLHPAVPDPALFDVRPMLERMVSLARNFPGCKKINIVQCRQDLMLYADEGLISQVVLNLLKNAVNATEAVDNGRVDLKAYVTAADEVVIEVSNNGPRIPDDIADSIFLPFFTTKPDGSGIGLSLGKQIMRACGGTLTLLPYTAQHPDTTFALTFR